MQMCDLRPLTSILRLPPSQSYLASGGGYEKQTSAYQVLVVANAKLIFPEFFYENTNNCT